MILGKAASRFILASATAFSIAGFAAAQQVKIGSNYSFAGLVSPPRTETAILVFQGANTGGFVTSATFGWSATNCPAAVEIKFFRPVGDNGFFNYITQRGPFDVTNPLAPAGTVPPVTQTVALVPPVAVRQGDAIAITNLTSCGGPTFTNPPDVPLPGALPFPLTVFFDGDVTFGVGPPNGTPSAMAIDLSATGPTRGLGFFSGRFEVNLAATNPRTGATTTGTARSIGDAAGYFTLPDFTGDDTFPEVTVKMVDATGAPPPFGGAFWFFHSSLTDVIYTLTVTDHLRGRVRTYSNAGSPAFCGGADTNAFPP